MSYLLSWNDQLSSFFLTEHESIASRKIYRSKSKGKEIHSRAWKYPVNTLLCLLDRSYILEDSDLLEPLSSLISGVTRPLHLLRKREAAATISNGDQIMVEANSSATSPSDTTQQRPQNRSRPGALIPPEVPENSLRNIINIITAQACSAKTFQQTLAAIFHLCALDGARNTILQELLHQGHTYVNTIQSELLQLHEHIETAATVSQMSRTSMAAFSSGHSNQAKFLRILKTVDYLYDETLTRQDIVTSSRKALGQHLDYLSACEALEAASLWNNLSECLRSIHQKTDMMDIATLLLPLIEALLVVCKHAPGLDGHGIGGNTTSLDSPHATLNQLFVNFTDEHRRILNQMVRNNPGLMSGAFSLLTKNPKVLDFDNKRSYFSRRIKDKNQQKEHFPQIQLHVRREAVFLDSYKDLHFKSGSEIKFSKLNIKFVGEEGVDAGGVSREWFQVLSRQMFDPNYALFVPVNADRNTYHPNKTSGINPEHLLFFKFVGRIVGKALYDGRLLDCHFSRPVYRKMLGKNVTLKDMETLDLEYYKSLIWMLENDITDVISESFSVERDDFGVTNIIDLIPNGRTISVNEQNKQEYVARVTEYRLLESVTQQLEHFMLGFNDIVPAELVAIFNEQELELLISGLPDVDPDDWRNNTVYHNYTAASPQIQWFWRAVRSFDDEERARLLQFCTGSSRIPIEGFANLEGMHGVQKFNIHRDYSTGTRLPQSHTCFNQLDLPEYENYESLRASLLTAISEGNEGFGFA